MTRRFINSFRRPLTVTSCAMASLLLVACGGGGESSGDSRLSETLPYSEQKSGANESPLTGEELDEQANSTGGSPNGGGTAEEPTTQKPNEPVQTPDDIAEKPNDPVQSPNDPVQTPNDPVQTPNNPVAGRDDDSANDDTNANRDDGPNGIIDDVVDTVDNVVDEVTDVVNEELWEGPVARVAGQITLEWFPPRVRENGEMLRDGEVGGYELRYRKAGSESFDHVILKGEWAVEHELRNLRGDYQFAVAAFDTNGLYSEFVNITPES